MALSVQGNDPEAWALFHRTLHSGKGQPGKASVFPSGERLIKPSLLILTTGVERHHVFDSAFVNSEHSGSSFRSVCTVSYIENLHRGSFN